MSRPAARPRIGRRIGYFSTNGRMRIETFSQKCRPLDSKEPSSCHVETLTMERSYPVVVTIRSEEIISQVFPAVTNDFLFHSLSWGRQKRWTDNRLLHDNSLPVTHSISTVVSRARVRGREEIEIAVHRYPLSPSRLYPLSSHEIDGVRKEK